MVTDEFGNKNFYRKMICPYCKEEGTFMNIGSGKDEWLCPFCKLKTDFGKKKIIQDKFGTYFVENDKNSLELRERIIEKLKTDGYLYSEFRNFLKWKNLDIELVFMGISNPENLINLYQQFKGGKEDKEDKKVELKEEEETEKEEAEIIPLTEEEKKNVKIVSITDLIKEVEKNALQN